MFTVVYYKVDDDFLWIGFNKIEEPNALSSKVAQSFENALGFKSAGQKANLADIHRDNFNNVSYSMLKKDCD